jgi:hypothetical protein
MYVPPEKLLGNVAGDKANLHQPSGSSMGLPARGTLDKRKVQDKMSSFLSEMIN